jgi:beta-lactam-binding protein with PASTA domain
VFAIVALGATAQIAGAVDEFATPRPTPKGQVQIKTQAQLGKHVTDVSVLRAPNVVTQSIDSARRTLGDKHLRVGRVTTQPTTERPAGTVISQDPKAGTPVQPGVVVNLVVAVPPPSKNPGTGTTDGSVQDGGRVRPQLPLPSHAIVPKLIGRPADNAPDILAGPGLKLGERRRQESDAPAGTVVAQFPAPGTRVRPGTSVDVTIADECLATVPDLTGEKVERAAPALRHYRLGLGQQRERESSAPAGTVIRQVPGPRTRVACGTLVNVLIATAPVLVPPPAPTPGPPVLPLPEGIVILPRPEPSVVFPPPAPPVAPAPPLPPLEPPVVTAPTAPSAPIVTPPPAVATAPPAPAPVHKPAARPKPLPKPKPVPEARLAPIPPEPPAAPVAPAPPLVARPPAAPPVRETPKRQWPSPIALGLGTVALLAAAGTVYYRVRIAQPVATPSITYAAHWDLGTQQIDAVAPLSLGVGLRLQSGVAAATTTLETHELVAKGHETGGTR